MRWLYGPSLHYAALLCALDRLFFCLISLCLTFTLLLTIHP